jgi:hypothetical protein
VPQRSNDFQKLIHFLETELAPSGVRVSESVMLAPIDGGGPVEVDVLIETNVGHHPIRIAHECRDHFRPATIAWINELAGRYAVLPIDRVVAVSRAGFTKGARHRAVGTKIQLITLKEAREADWPAECRGWRIGFISISPTARSARVIYQEGNPELSGPDLMSARITDSTGGLDSTVDHDVWMLIHTRSAEMIRDWWPTQAQSLLRDPEQTISVDLTFNAHDRVVIAPDGKRYPIDRIVITFECCVTVRKPEGEYYEYVDARVTQFSDNPVSGPSTNISLLLDPTTGRPRRVNVRREKT